MAKMKWYHAIPGVGPGIYAAEQIDKGLKKGRKNVVTRALDTGDQVLDRFQENVDDSGVRGELAKFRELAEMFGADAERSYFDTTEGKTFRNMIGQRSEESKQRLDQSAKNLNLTPEAYLAGLGQINEQEGDSLQSLVANADARRRSSRSQQLAALSRLLGGEEGLMRNQTQQVATAFGAGQQLSGRADANYQQNVQNLMNLFGGAADAGITAMTGLPV